MGTQFTFWEYQWAVISRAWMNSFSFLQSNIIIVLMIILAQFIGFILHWKFRNKPHEVKEEWFIFRTYVMAPWVIIFSLVFLLNIFKSPHLIYKDQQNSIANQGVSIGDLKKEVKQKPKTIVIKKTIEKPVVQVLKENSPGKYEIETKDPFTIQFTIDEPTFVLYSKDNKICITYLVQAFNNTDETRYYRISTWIDEKPSGIHEWEINERSFKPLKSSAAAGMRDIEIEPHSPSLIEVKLCYTTPNQLTPEFIDNINTLSETINAYVVLLVENTIKASAVKTYKFKERVMNEYRKQTP